jgi:hypothetical protein
MVEGSGTGCWPPLENVCPVFTDLKVLGIAAAQVKSLESVPIPIKCKEFPIGVLKDSATPMSTLIKPSAVPPTAVKEPS